MKNFSISSISKFLRLNLYMTLTKQLECIFCNALKYNCIILHYCSIFAQVNIICQLVCKYTCQFSVQITTVKYYSFFVNGILLPVLKVLHLSVTDNTKVIRPSFVIKKTLFMCSLMNKKPALNMFIKFHFCLGILCVCGGGGRACVHVNMCAPVNSIKMK